MERRTAREGEGMKQFDTNTQLINRLPLENSVYRHFKGAYYKVIGLGIGTEDKNVNVVYQSLTPEKSGNLWVRDAEMFLSPTDKKKYPDADQVERFKCVDRHIRCARHAIGLDYKGHRRTYRGKTYFTAWRNRYDPSRADAKVWEDLESWGLAEASKTGMFKLTSAGMLWLVKVCNDVDVIKEE